MTDLSKLKQYNSTFQQTTVDSPNRPTLPPDGDYEAVVDRFDFFEAKKGATAGQLLLKTELTITGPAAVGTPVEIIHNLEDPARFGFLKKHLECLGEQSEDLAVLDTVLAPALDRVVAIAIKTSARKNDAGEHYRNVYVNRVVGAATAAARGDLPQPDFPTSPAASDPDDIPF